MLRIALCGGVAVETDGRRLPEAMLSGRQGRLVLAYLVCERHRTVPREELAELVWADRLPSSWASSLSAVVSRLRRLFSEAGLDGQTVLASSFGAYRLHLPADTSIDWEELSSAVESAEAALAAGRAEEALTAARAAEETARRGFLTDECEWVDSQRRLLDDLHVRAIQAQAAGHLAADAPARAVDAARRALELDDVRESSYRLLMQSLAAVGERGEALRTWERCRVMLAEELGVNPSAETEAVYLSLLSEAAPPSPQPLPPSEALPSGVVTFLLSDIVSSSALWDSNPEAMAAALERHDHLVADTVDAHGGVLLKAKLEGDATVSVFRRASAAARAALATQRAIADEPWPEGVEPKVRMALHTGEAIERDGDYFGPALNRAARLRSLAGAGQVLVSNTVADVIRDHLPRGIGLNSLGQHHLRGLSREEHVFELVEESSTPDRVPADAVVERPALPAALHGRGVFVGRTGELDRIAVEWATAAAGGTRVTLLAGEPGVGKTRLASEWARRVHEEDALVLYGRCDEELGAPYQPFAEALRALLPRVDAARLRTVRGVEELARLVPEMSASLGGLSTPTQADPDTERSLLFDAVAQLFAVVSRHAALLLVIDDLHWAAKPTLLLLRHLLRSGDGVRLHVMATYRNTDLDRMHPLAAVLADLPRDGPVERLNLTGLTSEEVNSYLASSGYADPRLSAALSNITSGNPFFLIEVLRHVDESGGSWNEGNLPQGVREAVGRRLSRLSEDANEALLVGAVTGSRFSLDLVEAVLEKELIGPIDECRRAGLVVEESGNDFRFHHALVRQALLTEVASVRRIRLHQRIASALESGGSEVVDAHLADLARHWFECAFAGGAAKAVDYSRRAGEQAMARLAYEEAADLYDRAAQAAEVEGSGATDAGRAELLRARCEALLAAADPGADSAVAQLRRIAKGHPALEAWTTCYEGEVAVLTKPEMLHDVSAAAADAALTLSRLGDPDGEAAAHTVRASCLARMGRIAESESALDMALTAARRADNPRRVNAVLAGAPIAALWGPSPVARASGRCLDVIRVLRITTGSPAVEAVALRCQAVLESLRGRTDAARRMLASSRRAVEGLGHVHGLLEADLAVGMVELYAGDLAEAEVALRRAYEGFAARRVGVSAALAAALLARCELTAGRVEAALELTDRSRESAGADLQAAIAWRVARAEALAALGRFEEGLAAAREAVTLADPTDAVLDRADAHRALAVVLAAAGNESEARHESDRAAELYQSKGATALVEAGSDVRRSSQPASDSESVEPVRGRPDENDALRVLNRMCELFAARDWDALGEMVVPGMTIGSDRMVRTYETIDIRTSWRSIAAAGATRMELLPIATRGDRLVLTTMRAAGPDGYSEALGVMESDESGRAVYAHAFDIDDFESAFAALDARTLTVEDGRYASSCGPGLAFLAAVNRQDWVAARALISPIHTVADHRPPPALYSAVEGPDQFVEAFAVLFEVASSVRMDCVGVLAASEEASVIRLRSTTRLPDGGETEVAGFIVTRVQAGLIELTEAFAEDQLADAMAAFRKLTSPPVRSGLANTAFEVDGRAIELALCEDWEALAAMTAPGFVAEDRRRLVGGVRVEGPEGLVAFGQAVTAVGASSIVPTPIATRGERLSLARVLTAGEIDGARGEAEMFQVIEVDDTGRLVLVLLLDVEDLDAAYDLLDARWIAQLPPGEAAAARLALSFPNVYNSRDWEDMERRFQGDFVFQDRRRTGSGDHGPEGWLNHVRGLLELAPDARIRAERVLRISDAAVLVVIKTSGHDALGGEIDLEILAVADVRGGREHLIAFYDAVDVDRALEHFDSLCPEPTPEPPWYLQNAATEALGVVNDAITRADWSELSSIASPDIVVEDRRRLVGLKADGPAGAERMARSAFEAGVRETVQTPIAVRGDRLALVEVLHRGIAGETMILTLAELDTDGRLAGLYGWDPDEFDTAIDELDRRYLAKLDVEFGEVASLWWTLLKAYRDRDQETFRNLLSEDFNSVDQRLAGWGTTDAAALTQTVFGLMDLSPDVRIFARSLIRISPRVNSLVLAAQGHDASGGLFEMEFGALIVNRNRLLSRFDFFDLDALDAIDTRFEELLVEYGVDPMDDAYLDGLAPDQAEVWRATRALADAYNQRDWNAMLSALAEDCSIVDDRITGWGRLDREGFVKNAQDLIHIVPDATLTCVAVHRLDAAGSVGRFQITGTVPGGGEFSVLFESAGLVRDGKLVRMELLPEGHVEEAIRRLAGR